MTVAAQHGHMLDKRSECSKGNYCCRQRRCKELHERFATPQTILVIVFAASCFYGPYTVPRHYHDCHWQVLCSVPSVQRALAEVRRVLKPGGKFLFIEHVVAPDTQLRLLQHLLNPLQQATADGCHLDRDTLSSIQSAGFATVDASRFAVPGLGLIGPHVAGIATKS